MEYLLIPMLIGIWVIIWYSALIHEHFKYHFIYLKPSQIIKYRKYHFTWDYHHTHFATRVIQGKKDKLIYINSETKTCTPVPLDEL